MLNSYVMTAGGVQETELITETKHCSGKLEEEVMVNKSTALGRVHHSRCVYKVSLPYRPEYS